MTYQPAQQAVRQQALALGLAAVVTFGLLSGLMGLAHGEQAAQLAQQMHGMPQAQMVMPAAPAA